MRAETVRRLTTQELDALEQCEALRRRISQSYRDALAALRAGDSRRVLAIREERTKLEFQIFDIKREAGLL